MSGNLFTPVEDKKKKKKEQSQEEINTEKRKVEKRSLYEDERDQKKEDTMDGWDQTKLEDVINQKHGTEKAAIAKTTIICKHFVKAVENGKYGWFWDCPGGAKCMYRHALPPGYILKRDMEKEDEEEKISMEQLIEEERYTLPIATRRTSPPVIPFLTPPLFLLHCTLWSAFASIDMPNFCRSPSWKIAQIFWLVIFSVDYIG